MQALHDVIRSGSFDRRHGLFLGLALALLLALTPWGAAEAFTDVGPNTTHADAIADLSSRGIISGYPDGSFRPHETVLRMQFAKMIVRTLSLPVSKSDQCYFVDVPEALDAGDPLYPDNYVAVCALHGITRGKTATTFAPFDQISQQQLITMVTRAANLDEPPPSYTPPFAPGQFAPYEHYVNARKAAFHSLLGGFQELIPGHDFYAPATRGQACLLLYNLLNLGPPKDCLYGLATSVIDGDTIYVQLDSVVESVRLLGLDAPETGEPFSLEAKDALVSLVNGKTVCLETDVEERDQYDRLLAYVWVGRTMVNAEMLRLGLATLYTVPPNVKHTSTLQAAQADAQAAKRAIWGATAASPLEIVSVNYDAPGNDNFNLNEEYVTFKVLVSGTLLGYAVEDESGHRYEFPDRIFNAGQVFKLHTGSGTDSQTDLYWGMTDSAVWNNKGDTVYVLDPQGHIVATYSY